MEHLIQEMLSIARMESQDMSPGQDRLLLSPLIEEQLRLNEQLFAQQGQTLSVHLEPRISIRGDGTLLARAVENLLSNAAFSPEGAQIRVWCGLHENRPVFSIENTGVHIHEDSLPHLFEPFYREEGSRNRRTGGSGLGLYLVQMILKSTALPASSPTRPTASGLSSSFLLPRSIPRKTPPKTHKISGPAP